MVGRHHLVQIKDIEELALLVFLPSHHAPLPMMIHSIERNHGSPIASMGVLQHNHSNSGHSRVRLKCPLCAITGHFKFQLATKEISGRALAVPKDFDCGS